MQGRLQPAEGKRDSRCSRMHVTSVTVELVATSIGVLLVVLGALMGYEWEAQIDAKFQEEMVLNPNSQGVAEWISPSVNLSSRIYFWNWTNPGDIGKSGYKPEFVEVGPYHFREEHHKVNLTWNDNGTVSFRWQKFYYFDPEQSSGQLTDLITSVNTAVATLSVLTESLPRVVKIGLSAALVLAGEKIYWTHTVSELTFEGFDNPIVKFGGYLSSSAPKKFGYFYDRNGTVPSDVYNMATGASSIYSIGEVRSFNYRNTTNAHTGECANLKGSLGELMSPHLTPQSTLAIYAPDMCRPISYYYIEESSHNAIDTLVFASTTASVDNGTLTPENSCFCPEAGCEPYGVFDLRSCREGAPVMMSFPHLYLADPSYRDAIVGMNPDPEKHRFYLEMEPRTGIPMEVAARLQLNVKVSRNTALKMFRRIEDTLIPVFWIETSASLPESHTDGVKFLIQIISLGPYISSLVVTVGAIILAVLIARQHCWRKRCVGRRRRPTDVKMTVQRSVSDSLLDKDDASSVQTTRFLSSIAPPDAIDPLLNIELNLDNR